MRAEWIADVLRDAGLTVIEAPGWKLRGKAPFSPQAVVIHHTAGARDGDAPSLNVCIKGRADLPGPLCHVLLSRSGVCHVIAAGIANHAGAGSWRGLKGNSTVLGIEAENTGRGEKWTTKQTVAFEMCAAALLRHLGKDEGWVCGHKEWTPRKIDPAGLDMDTFRAAVRLILEDDMGLTADDRKWITELIDEKVGKPAAVYFDGVKQELDVNHEGSAMERLFDRIQRDGISLRTGALTKIAEWLGKTYTPPHI